MFLKCPSRLLDFNRDYPARSQNGAPLEAGSGAELLGGIIHAGSPPRFRCVAAGWDVGIPVQSSMGTGSGS
jgi:hypothetical protein